MHSIVSKLGGQSFDVRTFSADYWDEGSGEAFQGMSLKSSQAQISLVVTPVEDTPMEDTPMEVVLRGEEHHRYGRRDHVLN